MVLPVAAVGFAVYAIRQAVREQRGEGVAQTEGGSNQEDVELMESALNEKSVE